MPLSLALALGACASEASENPVVIAEVSGRCGPAARLVTDVCTQLGAVDECTDVDDEQPGTGMGTGTGTEAGASKLRFSAAC